MCEYMQIKNALGVIYGETLLHKESLGKDQGNIGRKLQMLKDL